MADLTAEEATEATRLVSSSLTGTEVSPVTGTTVVSKHGLDVNPLKYAPHSQFSGSAGSAGASVGATLLDGYGTAGIEISGTWSGTITFEGSIDGTTYVPINALQVGGYLLAFTATANGSYRVNIAGLKAFRAKMTSYTSGSADVTITCTPFTSHLNTDTIIRGATDGTPIGNVGDRLKIEGAITVQPSTVSFSNILKQQELNVASKAKTVITNTIYTVPAGKSFALASFGGSYDTQSPMYLRFEKQTGGVGDFVSLIRVTLKQHGQDESNHQIDLSVPLYIGLPGDVFRITYESALAKGTLWAGYTGIEY